MALTACSSKTVEAQPNRAPMAIGKPTEVENFTRRPTPPRQSRNDRVYAEVQRYVDYLEGNPQGADRANSLRALGNLYVQKYRDYEKAAHCYELYIQENPTDPNIALMYAILSDCYERLEWQDKANELHFDITQTFPEDSDIARYAAGKLTGQ